MIKIEKEKEKHAFVGFLNDEMIIRVGYSVKFDQLFASCEPLFGSNYFKTDLMLEKELLKLSIYKKTIKRAQEYVVKYKQEN